MYRLLFDRGDWVSVDEHLRNAAPLEDGLFVLMHVGRGLTDTRLLVHEVILPGANAWEAKGAHRLRPSGQWLSGVIGAAIETDSALGFMHSHPDGLHPPSLSAIDLSTSVEWSRSVTPTIDAPFVSMVWTPNGLSGIVFESGDAEQQREIERIEVLGGGRSMWLHRYDSPDDARDDRQRRALGSLGNARLRQLHVGVVGAGGTGSPVAEQLARMGVERVVIIDPDVVDSESNLRRVVGSKPEDFVDRTPKASIVERHLNDFVGMTEASGLVSDVRSEGAARSLLDCDVVVCTTDTHSSRSHVNQLALQYMLPVIDIGVKIGTSAAGAVSGMPAEVRVLLPDAGCLWCRGVLNAEAVRAENLPPDERRELRREGYIQGVDEPQPSVTPLNYFAASASLMTLLRLLSDAQLLSTSFIIDGWELYVSDRPSAIDDSCVCSRWRRAGDTVRMAYLPS